MHQVIKNRIEIAFDYHIDGVVKQLSAFFEVLFHFGFKIGLFLFELFGQFVNILIQSIGFWIAFEMYAVERIEFYKTKRHFDLAIPGKFFKLICHAEETGTQIKREAVFFELIEPASGLSVFFDDFYLITSFGQA